MNVSEKSKNTEIKALEQEIVSERKELHMLLMMHALDPLKNPMRIRKTRRNIARIATMIQQKRK